MTNETTKGSADKILVLRAMVGETEVTQEAFVKKTIVLGRDPYADVYLEDPLVSRVHASIRRKASNFLFVDHSSNGAVINGAVVDTKVLSDGDVITVGRFRILVTIHSDDRLLGDQLSRSKGIEYVDEQTIRKPIA